MTRLIIVPVENLPDSIVTVMRFKTLNSILQARKYHFLSSTLKLL